MKTLKARMPSLLTLGIYAFFCVLMVEITLQYFPVDFDVAFLRIKQDYTPFAYYRMAFYAHVIFAVFSLLGGFTQFSKRIRRQYPQVHRTIGKIYILTILLFAAPSGFIIGIHANGGFWSQLSFCLLAVLWFYTTWEAFRAIKNRDFVRHQHFMIRSFALTLSAITLRFWKWLFVFMFAPRPMTVYMIVAWLGWTLNLIIAELIISKYLKR